MKNEHDVDPKKDWVFKLMFTHGEMGNTALIDFLNAFLSETYGVIGSAEILNTELIKDAPNGETYRLDFLIKTDTKLLINLPIKPSAEQLSNCKGDGCRLRNAVMTDTITNDILHYGFMYASFQSSLQNIIEDWKLGHFETHAKFERFKVQTRPVNEARYFLAEIKP